jgi:hypothetical protein
MNGSNMRDKARAIFGKTFFENAKEPAPAKNGAVALQKRANARPIPTYKVGGVVKKQAGGALTAAEKARAEKMIRERGDAAMRDPLVMRLLDEKNRAPMGVPGMGPKAADAQKAMANDPKFKAMAEEYFRKTGDILGADTAAAQMKRLRASESSSRRHAEGGGIEAQRLEARTASGNYKKGGKIKKKADGGVMDQYDAMPASVQQTGYQQAAPAYGEYGAGPKPMQQMVANPNPVAPAYKKGGKVMKKADGGTAAPRQMGATGRALLTPEAIAASKARMAKTPAQLAAEREASRTAARTKLAANKEKYAATAARTAATLQKSKDVRANYAASQKAFADRQAAARQKALANPSPLMQRIQANKQQVEANKLKVAEVNRRVEAGKPAQAAVQKMLADNKAARDARMAARTPVNRAVGGRIEGSGMAADRGTAIPASREIMVTASKTPGVPPTRKVIVPVKRAVGGAGKTRKGMMKGK